MTQVTFDNITVSFGSVSVLQGLSLSIASGQFFTLLGPSGCGKTTVLRAIAGFIVPQQGKIRFGEKDITHVVPHKRNTGLVFQDYALFPHQSVFDNVAYGLRARKQGEAEIKTKVHAYLERVGLSALAKRSPSSLSGGQRQRVALARALVIEPEVLLMDEPLSALDANLRQEMRLFLGEIQREVGVTTVFVTHDQDEALATSDQIALIRDGQIEQVSPPLELHHRPRSVYAASFVGAANLLSVTVDEIQGEAAICDLMGVKIRVAANGCRPSDPAKLCVHHQEVAVTARAEPNGQTLAGTVRSVSFLGGNTRYDIVLANGATLTVTQSTGFGLQQFERGAEVALRFSDNCCLVRDA